MFTFSQKVTFSLNVNIVFSESGVNVSDRLSFVVIDDPIQHLVIVKHDIGCRVRIAACSLLGEVCVIGHLDL